MKLTPFSAGDELGFVIVKLRVVEVPRPIEAAPNDFVMPGAATTVRFAVALLPAPPLLEVTIPVVFG
jgi:hypothetical protein